MLKVIFEIRLGNFWSYFGEIAAMVGSVLVL
jgi:alkylated DNA nucleotide flippase Atl1